MGREIGHIVTKETREKIRGKLKGRKISDEIVLKMSNAIRKGYIDGKRKPYWLGKKKSEELRLKSINSLKERYRSFPSILKGKKMKHSGSFKKGQTPWNKGTKGVMKAWNKGKKHPLELIRKLKEIWNSPEKKEYIIKRRARQILPKKDTSIEIKIQSFLKQLEIEFFTHQYMHIKHGYQCDIFIPSKNLVIECDGNYWHKYPTRTEIDNIRTKELLEEGFKVLRLWESEIKVMKLNDLKSKLQ